MYYVYILKCTDQSLYVGCTNYTKLRRPVTLEFSEKFKTLKDARHRESEIKGWRRVKKWALIQGEKL